MVKIVLDIKLTKEEIEAMRKEGMNVYAMGKQLEQEAKSTIQGMLISQKNRWIK